MNPLSEPGTPIRNSFARLAMCGFAVLLLIFCSIQPARAESNSKASPSPVASPTPNLSNVDDILAGRRLLFPDDDFVMTERPSPSSGLTTNVAFTSKDQVENTYEGVNGPATPGDFFTAVGRMFNLPEDVAVVGSNGSLFLFDHQTQYEQNFPNTVSGDPAQNVDVLADLTGTGLNDLAYIANGSLITAFAANPNDMSQGFLYGTPAALPSGSTGPYALVAGDFDGGGGNELAVAYLVPGPAIAIAIYKPQVTTDSSGNVTALSLTLIGTTEVKSRTLFVQLGLAAGAYTGATNPKNGYLLDQLVLEYQKFDRSGTIQLTLQPIQVTQGNSGLAFTLANPYVTGPTDNWIVSLQRGYIDFFSNTEQLVMLTQGLQVLAGDPANVSVFTFDNQANLSLASHTSVSAVPITNSGETVFGYPKPNTLMLGNFDQVTTSNTPVALEIGLLGVQGGSYQPGLVVFHVDVNNNYSLGTPYFFLLGEPLSQTDFDAADYGLSFATGDIQGRSLLLGPPTAVYSVEHVQPHLILGAPPMQVDYITPAGGTSPEVLNLSAVPHGFYSEYQTQEVNQNQSSHESERSFNTAVKTNGTVDYQWGSKPLTGTFAVKFSFSAG